MKYLLILSAFAFMSFTHPGGCDKLKIVSKGVQFSNYERAELTTVELQGDELVINVENLYYKSNEYVLYWDGNVKSEMNLRFLRKKTEIHKRKRKDVCFKVNLKKLQQKDAPNALLIINRDLEIDYQY